MPELASQALRRPRLVVATLKQLVARCLVPLLLVLAAPTAIGASASLALNDIQVVGSHNSYKLAMAADRFVALLKDNPTLAQSLEYWHPPLAQQLDLGLRKLELDVFHDPDGSLYPAVMADARGSQFRVMHVQNLDDRSTCGILVRCLEALRAWSDAHPDHVPVFVSFNAKDSIIDRPGFVVPRPFDEASWQSLDAELLAVLGDRLLRPAEVFSGDDLRWPALDAARGKFVAILDEGGEKRRVYASNWRERAMFATLPESEPGAAILIVNDPIADFERIQRLVADGFIVRTRADADTREARLGDHRRRLQAFASGAQLVSTDYYQPASHFGTDYAVAIPTPPGCNPVRRPQTCYFR